MKIESYDIVEGDINYLRGRLEELLREGWQPLGGLVSGLDQKGKVTLYQAVVFPTKTEHESEAEL